MGAPPPRARCADGSRRQVRRPGEFLRDRVMFHVKHRWLGARRSVRVSPSSRRVHRPAGGVSLGCRRGLRGAAPYASSGDGSLAIGAQGHQLRQCGAHRSSSGDAEMRAAPMVVRGFGARCSTWGVLGSNGRGRLRPGTAAGPSCDGADSWICGTRRHGDSSFRGRLGGHSGPAEQRLVAAHVMGGGVCSDDAVSTAASPTISRMRSSSSWSGAACASSAFGATRVMHGLAVAAECGRGLCVPIDSRTRCDGHRRHRGAGTSDGWSGSASESRASTGSTRCWNGSPGCIASAALDSTGEGAPPARGGALWAGRELRGDQIEGAVRLLIVGGLDVAAGGGSAGCERFRWNQPRPPPGVMPFAPHRQCVPKLAHGRSTRVTSLTGSSDGRLGFGWIPWKMHRFPVSEACRARDVSRETARVEGSAGPRFGDCGASRPDPTA